MTLGSYLAYQPDDSQNVANPPLGAPENWVGPQVNDTIRLLMAAVRNLGDSTPKVDGDTANGSSVVGALAFRDSLSASDIAGLSGFVPVGAIIPFWGTLAAATAQLASGWLVCDGRSATVAGAAYTAPDLRLAYLRMFGNGVDPQSKGGSLLTDFTLPFNPTDTTGAHTLTMAEVPTGVATDVTFSTPTDNPQQANFGDQQSLDIIANAAGGHGHTHALPTTTHNHSYAPPFAAVIPLLRIF